MQKWQSRAEIFREHNEQQALTPLPRLRKELDEIKREYFAQKYDPNQPRVPVGNPAGGQWTSGGAGTSVLHRVFADADLQRTTSQVLSDASPDPVRTGSRYAQVSVERFDKTGDQRIDRTTETLMQTLARAHESVGDGAGPVYGIMVHGAFGADVKRQNLPGIGADGVEQSFSLRDVARYGLDGSIRTDVVQRDTSGRIIAVWDVKTGEARLSGPRVREIRDQVGTGPEVPVIELHLKRGVTTKGRADRAKFTAVIAVRLWGLWHPSNWDREAGY